MAATTPTAADLYNAAWQAKIDSTSALATWTAAGNMKSGPAYEAYLAANKAEAAANAAVAAGPSAPATVPSNVNVGPPERLTDQGIPSGYELGAAYNEDGSIKLGWELDPVTNVYKQTGRTQAPVPQKEATQETTPTATTAPDNALSAPQAGDVGTRQTVTPVTVEAVKPEQTVTTESLSQTTTTEKSADQKTVTSPDDSNHGTPYDDEGNLNNGWAKNEDGDAVWVDAGYNDATGRTTARTNTISTNSDTFMGPMPTANPVKETASAIPDWRVKLSLAKSASTYLYGAAKQGDILYPLKLTGGVIFPYTPQIQTAYKANYDSADLTHSNYKMHFYRNSAIEDVQITCDFTAQDSEEAAYVLAVIHFFKSVTKMFYGKDENPSAGTPPPLVYLSGYGKYQFNNHPMLISSFTYNLPNDVDYIRAITGSAVSLTAGAAVSAANASYVPGLDFIKSRLLGANLNKGGATGQPSFNLKATGEPTYIPTKIQIQLNCLPVVTRNDISNQFSLKEYAAGNLFKRSSGGIW